MNAIIALLTPVFSLIATLVGDSVLAKWVARVQVWWRTKAEKSLREKVEIEYNRMVDEWADFTQDQKPGPRS